MVKSVRKGTKKHQIRKKKSSKHDLIRRLLLHYYIITIKDIFLQYFLKKNLINIIIDKNGRVEENKKR